MQHSYSAHASVVFVMAGSLEQCKGRVNKGTMKLPVFAQCKSWALGDTGLCSQHSKKLTLGLWAEPAPELAAKKARKQKHGGHAEDEALPYVGDAQRAANKQWWSAFVSQGHAAVPNDQDGPAHEDPKQEAPDQGPSMHHEHDVDGHVDQEAPAPDEQAGSEPEAPGQLMEAPGIVAKRVCPSSTERVQAWRASKKAARQASDMEKLRAKHDGNEDAIAAALAKRKADAERARKCRARKAEQRAAQ